MKLWTIQTIGFYENLLRKGKISGEKELVEPCFIFAYDWMIDKMEAAIGKKPSSDCYPIWAWYQYKNAEKRRPDLRCSAHLPRGTKGVRLEIELDENDVLLSDFDLWHYPLNRQYLGRNKKSSIAFEKKIKADRLNHNDFNNFPHPIKAEIIKSWDTIFDLQFYAQDVADCIENKSIQAVFWQLSVDKIVKHDVFTAR